MIYKSKQWIEDIDIVSNTLPELSSLDGKSILITGATGLICSAIVDILIRYNETHTKKIKIFAAGRWPEKIKNRFGDFCNKEYFEIIKYNALKTNNIIQVSADYIIHGASNAYPAMIIKEPVETMVSNFTGVLSLLEYAKVHGTRRILYISSSEIYGKKEDGQPFKEEEYGVIDLLNSRNSYSVAKRASETLCISYANEYGVESVIARPGHIYGPTAFLNDNRVSSAFAYLAARGENIIMKSAGMQLRSYCYCLDCASAMFKILIKGEDSHAYNISNPESIITIKEMATILANTGNVQLIQSIATEAEKGEFNPMSNSSLESKRLQELGWKGCFNAEKGLEHTVQILRESQEGYLKSKN